MTTASRHIYGENEPMRLPWSKEPCAQCGTEGYATRTVPRPLSDVYFCEACEIWEEADAQYSAVIDRQRAEIAALEECIEAKDQAIQAALDLLEPLTKEEE